MTLANQNVDVFSLQLTSRDTMTNALTNVKSSCANLREEFTPKPPLAMTTANVPLTNAILQLESVFLLQSVVMTKTNALMTLAKQIVDAFTLQSFVMTRILAPSTLVALTKDANTLLLFVMTTTFAQKILVHMENVFMNQFQFINHLINAKFLLAAQRMDLTLMQEIVMMEIHALLTVVILHLENANTLEKFVMITTNVQMISVNQRVETAHSHL